MAKYTEDDLLALLDNCVPCRECKGKPKLFIECNFVTHIFCENAKRAGYAPQENGTCDSKSYDGSSVVPLPKDIRERIIELVKEWNEGNS